MCYSSPGEFLASFLHHHSLGICGVRGSSPLPLALVVVAHAAPDYPTSSLHWPPHMRKGGWLWCADGEATTNGEQADWR
jgi:hypothetical protein